MVELPEKYTQYLDTLSPHDREALFPAFVQSATEGEAGVLVRGTPDETQATVDESIPFGEVRVTKS